MAKYDPRTRYLPRQARAEVSLTFHEIETLVNAILPKKAQHEAWWANEPASGQTSLQAAAWLRAGYHVLPLVARERVVFRKIRTDLEGACVELVATTDGQALV